MKFILIWLSELIENVGTGLAHFALGVWVYQRTGSATQFSIIILMVMIPTIAISPFAGALVDRWDKRWTLILSKAGGGLSILILALLFTAERVEVWQVYVAVAVSTIFTATAWLAFLASVTSLVRKEHLGRASGMLQASNAVGRIASPMLAGVLMSFINVREMLNVNIAAFVISLAIVIPTRIPAVPKAVEVAGEKKSLLREALYGWKYIRERLGLVALLVFTVSVNFIKGLILVLFPPLVLSFSTPQVLGFVMSTGGAGMLLGSILISVWGGSQYRVRVVLAFVLLQGLVLCMGGLQPSIVLASVACFTYMFSFPIINGCIHAIWQNKVRPDIQGRAFALRNMLSLSSAPLGFLVAGVSAEKVFEPLLVPGGPLAGSVGQVIGVGAGRGIGLLFIVAGIFTVVSVIVGYMYSPLRLMESQLPDEIPDEVPTVTVAGGAAVRESLASSPL
jgi:MFS family permease